MIDLDSEKIKRAVRGDLLYYETLDSTNKEALRHFEAPDKSLFLTKNQTAGRGRMGRRWEASAGGIYMTVLLKPQEVKDISALTLVTGLAVAEVIQDAQIKWPNDIILNGKKVAGILLETKITGKNGVIAVGIGINANNTEFSEEISDKATSIFLQTGKRQDETALVIGVYEKLLEIYERFLKGFDNIREEYVKKCIMLNREITVITDSGSRRMFAVGIGKNGELIAEADGKQEAINFGDVSVRGILGYN